MEKLKKMSRYKLTFYLILGCMILMTSCKSKSNVQSIVEVGNTLNVNRQFETVELNKAILGLSKSDSLKNFDLLDLKTQKVVIVQLIDSDQDGEADMLLFQPYVAKKSTAQYKLLPKKNMQIVDTICYSRFVPERTDDYAWENDRVAFRTFGPKAQELKEQNIPEGTLASGIDAWLKRVEYPIINKWYKKYENNTGSYHEDTGEGLDNFHVGASRGIGGTAIKSEGKYHYSKNFIKWKTITNGPIRTSFKLSYPSYIVKGEVITESKIISLDKGSNFSKIVANIEGAQSIFAGLTLHDKKGTVDFNLEEGWGSHWETLEDSELGTGLVAKIKTIEDFDEHKIETADLSNLYMEMSVVEQTVTYYAGFGWKKSGHFNSKSDWENHIKDFARKINNPLLVKSL